MTNNEIWNILNVLRGEAEYQDFKYGSGKYEWELGKDIIYELMPCLELVNYHPNDTVKELMGLPIRMNVVEPQVIKLWREVRL